MKVEVVNTDEEFIIMDIRSHMKEDERLVDINNYY